MQNKNTYTFINKSKIKRSAVKLSLSTLILITFIVLSFYGIYSVSNFFDTYKLKFQSPIILQSPILKEKRQVIKLNFTNNTALAKEIIEVDKWLSRGVSPKTLTNVEKTICEKFGKDCKMALAISQAENGTRECARIAYNKHKDGKVSSDIGIFQINYESHKNKANIHELTDCKTNIEIAYQIYKQSGWTPWTTYNTGAYKKFLK